jgi:aldose sugar dehydrogenase
MPTSRLVKTLRTTALSILAVVVVSGLAVVVIGPGKIIQWIINPGPPTQGVDMARAGIKATTIAKGLENPWSLAFLPDGRMLVTERPGRLRIVDKQGKLSSSLPGLPKVFAEGQGGLLDVVLDPDFASNQQVYISFSEADPNNPKLAGTAVARGQLSGSMVQGFKVIWRQATKVEGPNHWGSRLVFAPAPQGAPQGATQPYVLFITMGDRFTFKEKAQDLSTHFGKVVRIYPDGSVPSDNPFVNQPGKLADIWSYGHRNIQGAALNPQTGALWTHEHGPQGGDELNIDQAGRNYGWPVITYGKEYVSGKAIGVGTTRADVEAPLAYWIPSIAPSGMAFLTSDRYPGWQGSLFVGSLAHQQLVRLTVGDGTAVEKERLLGDLGERIRDVRQGPDGLLYVLTDSEDGQIIRLDPVK